MRIRSVAAIAIAGFTLAACGGTGKTVTTRSLPDAHATTQVHVGGAPVGIATGAGGVWVADNAGSRVRELDTASGHPKGRGIPVGAGPVAVAYGEGYVWTASGDGTLTRIDPETDAAREAPARIADPGGIAAGEGALWVTSRARDTVTRIDPRSLEAVGDPIDAGAQPGDVAVGAGDVWVANTADGTVTRIDPSTGEPDDPIHVAQYQVLGLCFGEDGVWVAKTDDRLAQRIELVRIDPESEAVGEVAARIPAAIPVRLAAGGGGVWATLVGGVRPPATEPRPGQVALLDAGDLSVPVKLLRAGMRPAGVAVGEGAVWIANSGSGTVTRIGL